MEKSNHFMHECLPRGSGVAAELRLDQIAAPMKPAEWAGIIEVYSSDSSGCRILSDIDARVPYLPSDTLLMHFAPPDFLLSVDDPCEVLELRAHHERIQLYLLNP